MPENPSRPSPQSEEILQLIIENVAEYAIFATDPTGCIVSWNPGVRRLLGYDEADFIDQDISIIFTPEDPSRAPAGKRLYSSLPFRRKINSRRSGSS